MSKTQLSAERTCVKENLPQILFEKINGYFYFDISKDRSSRDEEYRKRNEHANSLRRRKAKFKRDRIAKYIDSRGITNNQQSRYADAPWPKVGVFRLSPNCSVRPLIKLGYLPI